MSIGTIILIILVILLLGGFSGIGGGPFYGGGPYLGGGLGLVLVIVLILVLPRQNLMAGVMLLLSIGAIFVLVRWCQRGSQ